MCHTLKPCSTCGYTVSSGGVRAIGPSAAAGKRILFQFPRPVHLRLVGQLSSERRNRITKVRVLAGFELVQKLHPRLKFRGRRAIEARWPKARLHNLKHGDRISSPGQQGLGNRLPLLRGLIIWASIKQRDARSEWIAQSSVTHAPAKEHIVRNKARRVLPMAHCFPNKIGTSLPIIVIPGCKLVQHGERLPLEQAAEKIVLPPSRDAHRATACFMSRMSLRAIGAPSGSTKEAEATKASL